MADTLATSIVALCLTVREEEAGRGSDRQTADATPCPQTPSAISRMTPFLPVTSQMASLPCTVRMKGRGLDTL
ncbi:hypothetical protein ACOMHN_002216 [Nucella lapillus]